MKNTWKGNILLFKKGSSLKRSDHRAGWKRALKRRRALIGSRKGKGRKWDHFRYWRERGSIKAHLEGSATYYLLTTLLHSLLAWFRNWGKHHPTGFSFSISKFKVESFHGMFPLDACQALLGGPHLFNYYVIVMNMIPINTKGKLSICWLKQM